MRGRFQGHGAQSPEQAANSSRLEHVSRSILSVCAALKQVVFGRSVEVSVHDMTKRFEKVRQQLQANHQVVIH